MKILDMLSIANLHKMLFQAAAFSLLFLCVVVPNSLQLASLIALTFCAMLAAPILVNKKFWPLLGMHLLICTITAIQIIVGHLNGAPEVAALQVFFIYIISPFLWILALGQLTLSTRDDQILFWILTYTALALISIASFYYLFLTFGPESVKFFISTPNVNLEDGYAGATMFVYGSLIFICSGFFATPQLIKNIALRYAILAALTISAFTSGRSALILSIFVGIFMGRILFMRFKNGIPKDILPLIAFGFLAIPLFTVYVQYSDINLALIFRNFFSEISSGGGSERHDQFVALLNGIIQNRGLGSGHGVGVSYLRSQEFPWRYELVWVATVFRVGLLGSFIYALPIIYFGWLTFKKILEKRHTDTDLFFLSGFIAALIASNTNPYIESFAFQWMLILPITRLVSLDAIRHKNTSFQHYKRSVR